MSGQGEDPLKSDVRGRCPGFRARRGAGRRMRRPGARADGGLSEVPAQELIRGRCFRLPWPPPGRSRGRMCRWRGTSGRAPIQTADASGQAPVRSVL